MSKPLSEVAREDGIVNDPVTPLLASQKPRKRSKRTAVVVTCLVILVVITSLLLMGIGVGGYFGYEHFFGGKYCWRK